MKTVMKRMKMLAMLTIVSMGAFAQTTVQVAIDDFDGGTIVEKSQSERTVIITVTPQTGYYIKKDDISVILVRDPQAVTRGEEIDLGEKVTLLYEGQEDADVTDPTISRDYSFTVPDGLGAWVEEAKFHSALDISGDGSNVSWSYDDVSTTVTITGSGSTRNFGIEGVVDPWASFRATITQIVVDKEVTGLGASIFAGCTSLAKIKITNSSQILVLGANALPANEGLIIDVPGNLYNAYKVNSSWSSQNIDSEDGVKMTNVVFSDNNDYDTFVSSENLIVPQKFSAFVISSLGETSVTISELKDVIPAGVPVLLLSKEIDGDDIRTTKATDEVSKPGTNLLKVAPEGGKSVKLGEVCLLYNDKLYYSMAGTVPAGGIYMALPENSPAKTRSYINIGDDSDTTGITTVWDEPKTTTSAWYSLDGRRLDSMPTRKGIYIKDGRKVVIK